MSKQIENIERRLSELEKIISTRVKTKVHSTGKQSSLTEDLDALMQKHTKSFKNGILFSGLAIPSDNPNRLVRWSGSGGFQNNKELVKFIEAASAEDISRFCSNFSTPEKMKIIKALITDGPLTQKEILESAAISQGQFYHHIKELISNKLVQKMKQDKYDLSPTGHVIAMSFIGITHTFLK